VVTFDRLAGVPTHYDRTTAAEYGTRGHPATFQCGAQFKKKLDATFADVWTLMRQAEVITTAGAYVARAGMHGQGRAFDLDGLFWDHREFVTFRDGYQGRNRKLYYGVEAVLRRHFGTVLDFNYNADHLDHFHMDDSAAVGFRPGSKSLVLFVQAALNEFYAAGLAVDGIYGPKTRAALARHAGNVTALPAWLAWLADLARMGWAHV